MKKYKFLFIIIILICNSCISITGGSNEFKYDFEKNEIIGSISRLEIEVDSPLTYYTYIQVNDRNTNRLNIINPDTKSYKFLVSSYSEDSVAYQQQRFIIYPNTQYKITNHSNGDSKSFSLILKTDSLKRFKIIASGFGL